jgi:protein KTI12
MRNILFQASPFSPWKRYRYAPLGVYGTVCHGALSIPNMPLVLMCGFPCSGKTTRADELADVLRKAGKTVFIVRDIPVDETADKVYANAASEKIARATLKSEVDRLLQKDSVVIADGPNYIKGYRYELYCIARSMKTQHCVIHVAASKDMCAKWNGEQHHYSESLFFELVSRFECPDSRNRWDR